MIKKNKSNFLQMKLLLSKFIFKTLTVLFCIYCITGCYTVLTPSGDYISNKQGKLASGSINIDYYSSHVHIGNCHSVHERYNSWSGTYYCDPFYYNHNYSHHNCNHYSWNTNYNWNNYNYSGNYTYISPKKTRRNKSFIRASDEFIAENSDQGNTGSVGSKSDTSKPQVDNSYSGATQDTQSTVAIQSKATTAKPRRKHARKRL